jgi:hypothetical protein
MELLRVWERGLEQNSLERALSLLNSARDGGVDDDPVVLTLGECDSRLLRLREYTFGPEITGLVNCPNCGHVLELNFRVSEIEAEHETSPGSVHVSSGHYEASFRLPNLFDLRVVRATSDDPEAMRRLLLARCSLGIKRAGVPVPPEQLPDEFARQISERMGEADPQAEVRLPMECLECHNNWVEDFDIEAFFWAEIEAWAGRTLNEVHQLAAAYGWREEDILGLTPLRRNVYLNLIAE